MRVDGIAHEEEEIVQDTVLRKPNQGVGFR